ncbi:MAG: transporter substrate-binding domain-containing protein, partial [Candidatus Aegiribacteria sp.]
YSPGRDRLYEFTQPHTSVHYVAVVREGDPPASFEELEGLSLAVERDDIMHDLVEEHGLAGEVTYVPNQEMAMREVALGSADCALVGRISALYWMDRNDWDLVVGSSTIYIGDYCIATARGNMALTAQFSEGLRILVETGAYRRIFEKWMGQPPFDDPVSFPEVLRRSLIVILPLFFLLLWILVWLRFLRRQVGLRTAELRRNQALLQEMGEIAGVGGWEFDIESGEGTWTEQTAIIHGASPEEPVSLDYFMSFYEGEYAGTILSAGREAVESGRPFDLELELVTPDGYHKWVRAIGKPQVTEGRVTRVRGSIQDVTDIKRAEERIVHLNRVLLAIRDINQLIVRENSPDRLIEEASNLLVEHRSYLSSLIILVDPLGNPVTWCQAGIEVTFAAMDSLLSSGKLPGCSASAVSSGTPRVIEGEDRKAICAGCPLAEKCAETVSVCVGLLHGGICHGFMAVAMEESISRNDEELELISEMAGDIAFALSSIADREARKRAEEEKEEIEHQLMQSQKMEAVGRLAGGVAHDFNNMLQVILGHSQMLLETGSLDPEAMKNLVEINDGAKRAAELTKQLLLFSRRQVMELKPVDFNTLVSRTLKMLRRLIGEDIRLEWLPGSNIGSIRADSGMIEQVLMNLCVNARDAMPKGGVLTIETMNVVIDSEYCANHAWAKPGRFVLLTVTDTGQGMEKNVMEHIFEPFFTTKPEGEGTGIGLATVYGIVRQHEGMITAYSEPGIGSMFKVYFPMGEQKAAAVGARIEGSPEGGSETILLAEDDDMVRQLAVMMLERAGYTVLTASDGEEAVEVFRANPSVDLLLLDVIMPKMGGNDVLEEIRAMDPRVRAVFTSGYTQNAIHTNFILHQGLLLLQKPYTSDRLLRVVRQALDSDPPDSEEPRR